MSKQQFEVLVALSKCSANVTNPVQAQALFEKLGPYLVHMPLQKFTSERLLRSSNPWTTVTKLLAIALIDLGSVDGADLAPDSLLLQYLDEIKQLVATGSPALNGHSHENGTLNGSTENGVLNGSAVNGTLNGSAPNGTLNDKAVNGSANSKGSTTNILASLQGFLDALAERAHKFPTSFVGDIVNRLIALVDVVSLGHSMQLRYSYCVFFRAAAASFLEVAGYSSEEEEEEPERRVIHLENFGLLKFLLQVPKVKSFITIDQTEVLHKIITFSLGAWEGLAIDDADLDLYMSVRSVVLEIIAASVQADAFSAERAIDILNSALMLRVNPNHPFYKALYNYGAYLSRHVDTVGPSLCRSLPDFVAHPSLSTDTVEYISCVIAEELRSSQDNYMTLIYTLLNMLTDTESTGSMRRNRTYAFDLAGVATGTSTKLDDSPTPPPLPIIATNSTIPQPSHRASDVNVSEYTQRMSRNVVTAIASIAASYGDSSMATLSSSMLSQKYGKVSSAADVSVIHGLALIAPHVSEKQFGVIYVAYLSFELAAIRDNDVQILNEISKARCHIAKSLSREDPLYDVYLKELLQTIVAKGDLQNIDRHYRSHSEVSATAQEIGYFLPPLAELLPKQDEFVYETSDWQMTSLFRNAWFNMVVHGYSRNSQWISKYESELKIFARNTPPLVSEASANMVESELELNTVLRRGSSHHTVNDQRAMMTGVMNVKSSLSYPKLMFLSAALLLETTRSLTGDCSKVLLYFGDPDFRSGDTYKYMSNVAQEVTKVYIAQVVKGAKAPFTVDKVAEQLKQVLILCCHRVAAIQTVSFSCADLLIKEIPSSLCRAPSLYALLDLLTLLGSSWLDAETDEYEPRSVFVAKHSDIRLELSDSLSHRKNSFKTLENAAEQWIKKIIAPLMEFEFKSLLTRYLSQFGEQYHAYNHVAMGCTFAMRMGSIISRGDGEITTVHSKEPVLGPDTASGFLSQFVWRGTISGASDMSVKEAQTLLETILGENTAPEEEPSAVSASFETTTRALGVCAMYLRQSHDPHFAHLIVAVPFKFFTVQYMDIGISLWLNAMADSAQLRPSIIAQVCNEWEKTVYARKGMYCRKYDEEDPQYLKMEYAPSNKANLDMITTVTLRLFDPHSNLIRFMASVLQASAFGSKHILRMFTQLCTVCMKELHAASQHAMARQVRLELLKFAIDVHQLLSKALLDRSAASLRALIMSSMVTWFGHTPTWPYGGNKRRTRYSIDMLQTVAAWIAKQGNLGSTSSTKELSLAFIQDEISKLSAWLDPLARSSSNHETPLHATSSLVQTAWNTDPALAVYLVDRSREAVAINTLENLIAENPLKVAHIPSAVRYFLASKAATNRALLYFAPTSPIEALNLFLPSRRPDAYIFQYAMRSLECSDVKATFFYVPQIVQCLRYDSAGYIERYILDAAKLSELFAHQIIWNIKANSYKDEDSTEPDPMKPTLDRVIDRVIAEFSPASRNFYEREFTFFNEVTSISGKLKPYIKKSKAEKKSKIDEEIAKIKVDVGVYLPSNPDGEVIAIDRKSGKPLQSHAKAPFLAKFKIRRNVKELDIDAMDPDKEVKFHTEDVWQGAIFKVGDDCRQDVLALQIISVFRSIFMHSGLDLYVYPYRVTATAPGCGVIDVLPNAISRDMLGREAVNGLYEYFTSKHGGEDSIDFQRARNNFVKSLAAYSVISFLIQFKDRHNGNIMYDDDGHILHIDFGFCFDIVPGGVKFEAAPFKLTNEMVAVMGGSTDTQAYKWFEELCVKAFLASRPYAEIIIQMVMPMLDSGLPCFKGETTIKKLRSRFVLDKTEREAAAFFRSLIKKSVESFYTKGYDEFQRITNGIPY